MQTVMDIVRLLHSLSRYLALILLIGALIYFVVGLVQRRAWDATALRAGAAFRNALRLQWVLGILLILSYLIVNGNIAGYQIGHALVGTVALGVSEGAWGALIRRAPDDRQKYVRALGVLVLTVLIVIGGIYALPEYLRWNFPASNAVTTAV